MAEGAVVEIKELYEVSGYVNIISERSISLERTVTQMEENLIKADLDLRILRKKALGDLSELKDDVRLLKSSVSDIQKLMVSMISQLKNTLKNDDFDRFSKRVDYWAPEALVNRREVRRLIKEN
jgi:hypothetical protein